MATKTDIVLIVKDIRSTHNVGSIFRSAECFGVSHIYLCGYTPAPLHENDTRLPHIANKLDKQIEKTALGSTKLVPFTVMDIKEVLEMLKNDDFVIASLELNDNSVHINDYKPPRKVALTLGNEVNGVDEWTLKSSDVILEIEQFGIKESLNVANATAIALYALRTNK